MRFRLQNMHNDKGRQRCLKVKRSIVMMVRRHGGMECMAQEYHGDGDVNGPLHKIDNVSVTNR